MPRTKMFENPMSKIRRIDFIYNGTSPDFTRFLTLASMDYLREEESKNIRGYSVDNVECHDAS